MAFQDYFGTPIAYDPTQDRLVADAAFTVHATDDTSLSTPLTVLEPGSGATIPELRSSSIGVLPDFRVDGNPPQVLIKSGPFVTKLTSVYGAILAAGLDPDTVAAAIQAGADATAARDVATSAADDAVAAAAAATAVGTTNDAIMAGVAADQGSEFLGQMSATFAGRWQANRHYAAGAVVITPAGNLVRRLTEGNAAASWTATEAAQWVGTRGEIFATDFGVTADGTTDDGAAMVSALATAATLQVTLRLPGGKVKVNSLLTWKHRLHDIEGGSNTILDFSGISTNNVTVFTLDPTAFVSDIAQSKWSVCRGVHFLGSLSNFTNTHGITHLTTADTVNVRFENCSVQGFKNQVVLKDNAYLWKFSNCSFRYAMGRTFSFGGLNMGENFHFEHCKIFNNNNDTFVYTAPTNAGDIKFSQCSFDGGAQVADLNGGTVNWDDCHFEGTKYGPQWVKMTSGGSASTVAKFTGGQLYISTRTDSVRHVLFRIGAPLGGSTNPVSLSVDGLHIIDRSNSAGAILVKDESGLTHPWGASANLIKMRPQIAPFSPPQEIAIGSASQWLGGALAALPTVGTGTAQPHQAQFRSSYSTSTTPLAISFDSAKTNRDGIAGAVLFSSATTSGTGTFLARRFLCRAGRQMAVSVSFARENLLIGTGGMDMRVSWWADTSATTAISTGQLVATLIPQATTADTVGWRTVMLVLNPPPGALLGEVWFGNAAMSGKIWVQDFDILELT
ncbi:MAG TPA: hypothetical protein VN041_02870 [Microbacterium sp.]|nr:hypothetical protein [Microbacterium sp.]